MNFPDFPTSMNDPIFQSLVRRKKQGEDTTLPSIQEFPQSDIDELESFCRSHGILGFNCGRMNPKAALQMLKSKLGVVTHKEVTNSQIKQILKG
jgi:hypothetical protein